MTTSSDPPPASAAPGSSDGGAELVVVANRLPVDLVTGDDGDRHWRTSPGGLVTALAPTLREQGGVWVGWPGIADDDGGTFEPFTHEGMDLHPVGLSAEEVADYYEGFANATLWPLYHDVVVPPVFDRPDWWDAYERVNRRFAEAAADVAPRGATVWVQDYQLQLVPALLRARRPDLRIGFFLHIPFPPPELFRQLPWRREVLDGLLGADLVGFQVPGGAENFRRLAHRLSGVAVDDGTIGFRDDAGAATAGGRTVRIGAFPISIDSAAMDARGRDPEVAERARTLRKELGDPEAVLLGVDRLDYTKGIDVRLRALGDLFAAGRLDPTETVLVQVATPSRERVSAYQDTREEIETTVGRINGDHGTVGHPVVHYLHQSMPPEELAALYRAADVMLVTPVRDGMNLVAKEYVAARTDGGGALVLSEFTGASEELEAAHSVNPHDEAGVRRAILDALATPEDEARERMAALRSQVAEHDVALWARSFLAALRSS